MHPEMSNLDWFEYLKTYGSKPGLQPIKELLTLLGDPQRDFASIHVTGTNGKGSTTAMTASILTSAGYKTGMFTSPHLSHVSESIKIDDMEIPLSSMEEILGLIREKTEVLVSHGTHHPTQFEVLVALAYTYFSQRDVDIAVIEVGMGGRDDATNVIDSLASIVTNISLEHTQWLGSTLEAIAETKAGILRQDTQLISAATQPSVIKTLREIADEKGSLFTFIGEDVRIIPETSSVTGQTFTIKANQTYPHLSIPLVGSHQLRNAACAIAAVEAAQRGGFKITPEAIKAGLASVRWVGRFEIVAKDPLIILDGAKDAAAVDALVETVKQNLSGRRIITIFGVSSDKANESMIQSLSTITDQFILTEHRVLNRTAKATDLEAIAKKTGKPTKSITPVSEAIEYAKTLAQKDDVILVTGSVFLIGEAREHWYPA